jgi:hypothetical protein
MARRETKRSTQSAALNRPARKRYNGTEPTKNARPPRQAEGRHSKPDVPGKGRLTVRGGVLPMPRGSGRH